MKMNTEPTKKPQKKLIKATKKFFHKTITNLKSFLPKATFPNPITSNRNKINSNFQEVDDLYTTFSEKWESNDIIKEKKVFLLPTEGNDKKEDNASTTQSEGQNRNKLRSFLATDKLLQRMKELEMMDMNDVDHEQDIEEVLQNYSRLTCPAYQEMVDLFFMDMYSEYHLPKLSKSRSCSMRKLSSTSVHGSMRKLRSAPTVHSSMRCLGPITVL